MVGAQDLDDAGLAAAVAVSSLGEIAVGEVVDVADVTESNTVAVLADDLSTVIVGVCVQAVNQLLVTMGYRLDIVPICDSEYEEMEEMQNEKKTDL